MQLLRDETAVLQRQQGVTPDEQSNADPSVRSEATRPERDQEEDSIGDRTLKPEKLEPYYGKTAREHRDWTRSADTAFRLSPSYFRTDRSKVLFAMQSLRGDP